MDDKKTEIQTPTPPIKIKHAHKFIFGYFILIIFAGAMGSVYSWQHKEVNSLNVQIHQKQVSIASIKKQITVINNHNNGVTATSPRASNNTVALVNSQVTFTLPSGWVIATASKYAAQCYIGGLAAQFCLDTTTIVPKALNVNSDTSSYSGINVSVFKHSDSTNAEDWYNNDFDAPYGNASSGNQETSLTINGYNACYVSASSEPLIYGDEFDNEAYVIVNNPYVVLITSNVYNNAGINGTTVSNNNSQYSSVVKSFSGTVKMQDN
jgi:hypothetical protein